MLLGLVVLVTLIPPCSNAVLTYNHTEHQRSGSFEVLTLAMMLGNGSGIHFGASQCIPMGPCHLTRCLMLRLTLGVVIPLPVIWPYKHCCLDTTINHVTCQMANAWVFTHALCHFRFIWHKYHFCPPTLLLKPGSCTEHISLVLNPRLMLNTSTNSTLFQLF